MSERKGASLFFALVFACLFGICLCGDQEYTISDVTTTSITLKKFVSHFSSFTFQNTSYLLHSTDNNNRNIYYCKCSAECFKNGQNNYQTQSVPSRAERTLNNLNPNTNYCFFDNLSTRNVDYRIKTAPSTPSSYSVFQTNVAVNPTALQANWGSGATGEGFEIRYRVVRRDSSGFIIDEETITVTSKLFTASLDTVTTYEVYATNLETIPLNGKLIYSSPAVVTVAIPSPPQINSVTFSSTHAFIQLDKVTPLPVSTSVCGGRICTSTSGTMVTVTWNPNIQQLITAQNVYGAAYLSSVQTTTSISPPAPPSQGSFIFTSKTSVQLNWTQPVVGSVTVNNWFVTIYTSDGQVIQQELLVSSTLFPFSMQQGSSYYATIVAYNGQRSIDSLRIPFGSPPIAPTILSFQFYPLQSKVILSHLSSNQNLYYIYQWTHSFTHQQVFKLNSTTLIGIWDYQGTYFGFPITITVSAWNLFGMSEEVSLALPTYETMVIPESITQGKYSFVITSSMSIDVLNYHILIKDSSDGHLLASVSELLNNTIIISSLPPVTSCSIYSAVDVPFGVNQNATSIASLNENTFVTLPLAIQHFSLLDSNETSLLFTYQDHPANPFAQSITIQLFDSEDSVAPLFTSDSLQLTDITSSSGYFAKLYLGYRYNSINTFSKPIYVTTPPFAPQFYSVEYFSNNIFSLSWKSTIQGKFPITLYNVTISVQDSDANPTVISITTALSQWQQTNLIPNAKYIIQITSINSALVSSLQTLQYEFYSYPENPFNYLHQVYADYIVLQWLLPSKAHPALQFLSFEIVYFEQGFANHNISVSLSKSYVPNAPVNHLIMNLEPEKEYIFCIKTEAIYSDATKRSLGFGGTVHSTTEKAIAPTQAPTVSEIDSGYLTQTSFLIQWSAIPESQTRNSKLIYYTIHLNYTENGVAIYKQFNQKINTDATMYSYLIQDIPDDTRFQVSVTGINKGGASPLSNIVTVTTLRKPRQAVNNNIIYIVLIPLFSVCVLIGIITLIVMLIIVGILIWIRKRKKHTYVAYELQESLLPKEISSRYIIDCNALSFSDSIVLGTGSQGTVCTATFHGVPVAVKIYPKMLFGVQNDFSDFYNESLAMSKFSNHINIVRFIGIAEDLERDQLMLITELCKGGNLATYAEMHALTFENWNQKLHILIGVASGMSFLHSRDVAHRDLKCENVLLDETYTAKIIDFGFTKQIKEGKGNTTTVRFGTACYLAPEAVDHLSLFKSSELSKNQQSFSEGLSDRLIKSESEPNEVIEAYKRDQLVIDMKCDVYSFAIIMYVLLTGKTNPYGKQVTDIQILHQMHLNPNLRPVISQEMQQFVQTHQIDWYVNLMKKCWSSDAKLRPSFATILSLLQDYYQQN